MKKKKVVKAFINWELNSKADKIIKKVFKGLIK